MLELLRNTTVAKDFGTYRRTGEVAMRKLGTNRCFSIEGGSYTDYFGNWIDAFAERLKIAFFDRLQQGCFGLLDKLSAWIEIDGDLHKNENLAIENRTVHYRNRSLHKPSLGQNQRGERLFRAHSRHKVTMSLVYMAINGSRTDIEVSEKLRLRLHASFADSNRGLVAELVLKGYRNVPAKVGNGRP